MNQEINDTLNIVITGASSGIGREIALEMANSHHNFYLIGRNEERLKEVAKKIEKQGRTVYYGTGDVGSVEDTERLYNDALGKLKSINVLVANAGVGYFGPLEELSIKEFDDQFNTNVRSVFLWLKKVLPKMKEQNNGQIIATSSNLGFNTGARATLYAATKHAVQAMIGGLREELKGTKVKAATLNPGSVNTPWFDGKEVDKSKMLSAKDVAKAARFIIEQSDTCDIDHIYLLPAKR
jgi:3-oxoacyl-[acyl-carrier protein] reductase